MARFTPILLIILVSSACGDSSTLSPTSPTSPPATVRPPSEAALAYMNQFLDIMQANALHRATLDWPAIRSRVIDSAGGAQTIAEVHRTAVPVALRQLRDNHSLMLDSNGVVIAFAGASCTAGPLTTLSLPANIGYVSVGTFSGNATAAEAFTARVHSTIVSADRDDLHGWIVDLRANGGGNMWPMLAGLVPILGDGVLGFFVHPDGRQLRWEIRETAVILDGSERMRAPSAYTLRRPAPRVAVLTDGLVGSSGEAVVVAFRNRPDTRSFGTGTCGLSTANTGFPLSDGSTLVLTVAVMADRTGTAYGGRIEPDEVVVNSHELALRAVNWLARQ